MNLRKQDKLPAEWMDEEFQDSMTRQEYCDRHYLNDIPRDTRDFEQFREQLRKRIADLIKMQ